MIETASATAVFASPAPAMAIAEIRTTDLTAASVAGDAARGINRPVPVPAPAPVPPPDAVPFREAGE